MTGNSNPITVEIAKSLCEDPWWCGEDFDGIEPKAVEVLLGYSEIALGFLGDIVQGNVSTMPLQMTFSPRHHRLRWPLESALSDAAAAMLARYQETLLMESPEVLLDSKGHGELAKKRADKGSIRWGLIRWLRLTG
jgi:hypothetical protein